MIIDAIIFFNELDVLNVRLHELDSVVDKFVIVEALEVHGSTTKKSAVLADRWAWDAVIKPFEHKVKYVVLPRLEPPHTDRNSSWPRENFHRNALMDPIVEIAGAGDPFVMVSDCDEIPRAAAVRAFPLGDGIRSFEQDLFYYDVNNYLGTWHGTCGGLLSWIRSVGGLQAVRNRRDDWPTVKAGGWHFSYFGGLDRIMNKVRNFAHAQEDIARLVCCRSSRDIANDILTGGDLYQRPGEGRKERRSHDDPRLPSWLREHIGEFRHFTEDGLREMLSCVI